MLVAIVSTDDGTWLKPCLSALRRSSYQGLGILLIANECGDETVEVGRCGDFGAEVLELPVRAGFAEANNLALVKGYDDGYEFIFLLNPDTLVHPEAISRLVRFLQCNSSYGIVGSEQVSYNGDRWDEHNEWCRETFEEAAALGSEVRQAGGFSFIEHYYVQGSALMLRSSLIPRIGLLDPVYETFYEETDLCRRCFLANSKVAIVIGSKVKHAGGGNWRKSRRNHLRRDALFLRNSFLFFLSHPDSGSPWAESIKLVAGQVGMILRHDKDIILPIQRYPLVLWHVLRRVPALRRLKRRNRRVLAGAEVPREDWAIASSCASRDKPPRGAV